MHASGHMSTLEIIGIVVMLIIFGAVAYADIFVGPRLYQKRVAAGKDPITNLAKRHPKWAPYIYGCVVFLTLVFGLILIYQDTHP
jgi:hypothetical protein